MGDISQKIVEITDEAKGKDVSYRQKEIEEIIRSSLFKEVENKDFNFPGKTYISDQYQLVEEKRLEKQRQSKEKYNSDHGKLEATLTNRTDLRAIKLGLGKFR